MTRILLIRHGQASFGTGDYDRLSETGVRQAVLTGAYLKTVGLVPTVAVCGGLRRQIDTASHALAAAGCAFAAESDADFDEYHADAIINSYLPLLVAGKPHLAGARAGFASDHRLFQEALSGAVALWTAEAPGHDGESWPAFAARVRRGLKAALAGCGRDDTLAIFTSGGVIAALIGGVLDLPADRVFTLNWRLYNASISELGYGRSGLALVGFNEPAHLRLAGPEMLTFR